MRVAGVKRAGEISVRELKRLGLKAGTAAFYLERLGTRDGTPVEWRTTVVRGDRYRFVAEWSATGRSQLRPSAL